MMLAYEFFSLTICADDDFLKNNEAEALRSWRSALDQIYYHNAYRVPPNYHPKSETEKALQDSLRDMELQCKERVDLLDALRKSRLDAKRDSAKQNSSTSIRGRSSLPAESRVDAESGKEMGPVGQSIIPAVSYPDLSKQPPPLPQRPAFLQRKTADNQAQRAPTIPKIATSDLALPQFSSSNLPSLSQRTSRTPSPDKRNRMLTTLRPNKDGKRPSKSPRGISGRVHGPPAASKAAGLAWDSVSRSSGERLGQTLTNHGGSTTTLNSIRHESYGETGTGRRSSANPFDDCLSQQEISFPPDSPIDLLSMQDFSRSTSHRREDPKEENINKTARIQARSAEDLISLKTPTTPSEEHLTKGFALSKVKSKSPVRFSKAQLEFPSYRSEYPPSQPMSKSQLTSSVRPSSGSIGTASLPLRQRPPQKKPKSLSPAVASRRPVANSSTPRLNRRSREEPNQVGSSESADENTSSSREAKLGARRTPRKKRTDPVPAEVRNTPPSTDRDSPEGDPNSSVGAERINYIKKHLPKGVDENAAKQIFNEIVVQGDEVHWADVAGLDVAKNALKEAVVYPFLRPDLFMGLREPARGMLLFGPPGTGKTMLARAVATESRSTFFAISASSLTSKWLGESEKLVRALFALAKALAPSIIFVDEIDSLLSSRGGSSEHESTRRIKTEFLIQWSDLQRAAAGKEQTDRERKIGDASRVLVLAATNMPWAIDEAARRRFVRRQYIPLPEAQVRGTQLRTLLGHQKHDLNERDIQVLIELTDGMNTVPPGATFVGIQISKICLHIALRLLGFRYHGFGERCRNGSSTQPWRGAITHVYG